MANKSLQIRLHMLQQSGQTLLQQQLDIRVQKNAWFAGFTVEDVLSVQSPRVEFLEQPAQSVVLSVARLYLGIEGDEIVEDGVDGEDGTGDGAGSGHSGIDDDGGIVFSSVIDGMGPDGEKLVGGCKCCSSLVSRL
ncbi:MAG: hypothetical protein Q9221_003353 [Calogaya cf. arnoldii]